MSVVKPPKKRRNPPRGAGIFDPQKGFLDIGAKRKCRIVAWGDTEDADLEGILLETEKYPEAEKMWNYLLRVLRSASTAAKKRVGLEAYHTLVWQIDSKIYRHASIGEREPMTHECK